MRVSIASPFMQPSPNGRRVGIRIVTFEACPSFTYVAARRIAQSPKATFVTRLQPCQLPSQAARQLPDQSTILRVESSSTDDSRLRGARPLPDKTPAFASEYGTLDHHGRGYRGIPSIRLGPSLKDHVERPRRRPSNPRKPAVANDFGELGLTRLRTQAFAHFLVQ